MSQLQVMKKRIQNITDEVKVFHPLLDELFKNMPSIQSSECTHGVNERGADFILQKFSEEFQQTDYIGVVVKVGKLTQTNCSGVLDQIRQCQQRRFISSGTQEVYPSEVWVVINGNISQAAKERIFHECKSQNIRFMDIALLVDLISKNLPTYFENIPVKLGAYLAKEETKAVQRDEKTCIIPSLNSDLNFEQEIVQVITSNLGNKKKETVDFCKAIESGSISLLEAPMGGGKSKLLNGLVKHYSIPSIYSEKKILPYYLQCQEVYKDDKFSIAALIENIETNNALESDNERQYLFLMDGLDEVEEKLSNESNKFLDIIHEADQLDNVKVVISSRFIGDENLESELEAVADSYEVCPLSLKKIINFITALCSSINIEKRIFEDLKNSSLFKSLPKTPIAAIILAKLINEGSEDIPANLTELYAQYSELSLGRWDADKGLTGLKEFEALDSIIQVLASDLLENNKQSLLKKEVIAHFKEYLSKRNLNIDLQSLYSQMLDRSSILTYDERLDDISFRHRSFAEFFYAKHLDKQRTVEISEKVFHPYWANSYFFYVGLKKDCPEILTDIINIDVSNNDGARLAKMVNLGSFLLAAYKTPYDIIAQGVHTAFNEMASYYLDISERRKESFLDQLPKLYVLGIFCTVANQNYSYAFFQNAIQQCVEDIETTPITSHTEESPFSLLLLDAAQEDTRGNDSFNNLETTFGRNTPLPISLLLTYRKGSDSSHKATPLRNLEKRIRKNLKRSREFRAIADEIANKSINGRQEFSKQGKRLKLNKPK